ncbi:putative Ran binding domain, PH-like domain superfamily, nuclear pore complex, NUP2/50/61 [Dioscorea sansibarensis]
MADAENALPATKKRVAGRQISKDDPTLDDDDVPESEIGTFQRASDEVLATRRIVKVKRSQPSTGSSSNPFAGICLVNPTDAVAKTSSTDVQPQSADVTSGDTGKSGDSEQIGNETSDKVATATEENGKKADDITDTNVSVAEEKGKSDADDETEGDKTVENGGEKTDTKAKETASGKEGKESSNEAGEESEKAVTVETEKEKPESSLEEKSGPAAHLSSFQQLSSSQNAFTGLAGTGFSSSSFSFGSNLKDGSTTFGGNSGSIFGLKNETSTFPSFGIGNSNNEKSSFQLFGSTGAGAGAAKSGTSGITSMPEVPIETGEENEKAVFTADAILYEYLDGGWKERGKGELKVNVSVSGSEKARLIMRARGNYRLILNASLYPDMSLTNMEKKGITFACINSAGEGKDGLSTFALKFKDASFVEEFQGIVTAHKGKKAEAAILKTPENSPKASDD